MSSSLPASSTGRLVFSPGGQSAEFFGKYLEVTPSTRLVWTNDEGGAAAATVTTVTFEEMNGGMLVTVHDLYPSKEALDEALEKSTSRSGARSGVAGGVKSLRS